MHVPFCAHRCDYCAFATYADRDHLMAATWTRCSTRSPPRGAGCDRRDVGLLWRRHALPTARRKLLRILDAIPRTDDAEVTVECNPEDASLERLRAYRDGGVTRMSFGVQSTQRAVLADLGRRHGIMAHREVSEAVTAAGFATWNMDLIVGSRAESLDDVRHTLDDLLTLEHPPPHISCYALTPEPATPLGRDPAPPSRRRRDGRRLRPRGRSARRARLPVGRDLQLGEARPRVPPQSRLLGSRRLRGIRFGGALARSRAALLERAHADRYIELMRHGESPLGGEEFVDEQSQRFERESLALRTARGVPLEAFDSLEEIKHLVSVQSGHVVLTPKARLVANQVIVRLKSSG